MRYLGVDYGFKRVGLAVSDEEGRIAFSRKTLEISREAELVDRLCKIAKEEKVERVIMGLPSAIPGMDAHIRETIQDVAQLIHDACGLPVEFENELFSTKIAELHSKKNADASAAAIILQSFLDRRNRMQ